MADDPLEAFRGDEDNRGASDPRHFMYKTHASNAIIAFLVSYSLVVSAVIAWVGVDSFSQLTTTSKLTPTSPTEGLSPDANLLVLVALAGALGGLVHLLTSLGTYVGERKFMRSWTLFYLFRPVAGSGLAIIVYFTLRMATPSVQTKDLSLFAILAYSALSGLFARQAVEKLAEIFDTMFRKIGEAVDKQPVSALVYHPDEDPVPPPSPGQYSATEEVVPPPGGPEQGSTREG